MLHIRQGLWVLTEFHGQEMGDNLFRNENTVLLTFSKACRELQKDIALKMMFSPRVVLAISLSFARQLWLSEHGQIDCASTEVDG